MNLVTYQVEHKVAHLTLNRPQAKNALNAELIADLVQALRMADEDSGVHVIVLKGASGDFCAGGDVKDMRNRQGMFAGDCLELRERYLKGIQQLPLVLESIARPTIAAVQGVAIGAGCDLACMCDLRLADQSLKMGETFASLGLIPGDGGAYFLERIIGYGRTMELLYLGELLTAQKALEWGLVSDVFDADSFSVQVEEFARRLASKPQRALQMSKRAAQNASARIPLAQHLELMAAYQGMVQTGKEHARAVEELLAKKRP